MVIPKYYKMHRPVLESLGDEQVHTLQEVREYVAQKLNLSEQDLAERLAISQQTVFSNRIGWARTYLKKAGLLDSPARATFVITEEGKRMLREGPEIIDRDCLMKYDSFREFVRVSRPADAGEQEQIREDRREDQTPEDTLEEVYEEINSSLAEELLDEVSKLSPFAFEQMVLDLMIKMGYGTFDNAAQQTSLTGDGGIDGIIMEDKLGFNLIYIQTKLWSFDRPVGRREIQGFVGAISGLGGKGLFVTTSSFTQHATSYAKLQHIILIDGPKLARLMIEHDFGVTVRRTFKIKSIDTDVFNAYQEQ